MKIFSSILLLFFVSCSNNSTDLSIGEHLEKQVFSITTGSDTILITDGDIEIIIAENSFSEKGKLVDLVVKEALTRADMVLGNLSTRTTGDQLLISDGMLNIGTESDIEVNKENPIYLKIPTKSFTSEMKVFEGEIKNGNLLWGNEQALQMNESLASINKGEELFYNNCASCHNRSDLSLDMTGPALGNISQFRDKEYLYSFTRNSYALIATGHNLANCLYNQYNKSVMTAFPAFSNDDLKSIYDFIESESRNQELRNDAVIYIDSCDIEVDPNDRFNTTAKNFVTIDTTYVLDALGNRTNEIASIDRLEVDSLFGTQKVISTDFLEKGTSFYRAAFSEFNWINIDKLFNRERDLIENITIEIEHDFDVSYFNASLVLKDYNTIIPLYFIRKNEYSFAYQKDEIISFFKDEEVSLVFWTQLGKDEFCIGVKNILTKEEGNNHKVKIEKVNGNTFKDILGSI